MSRKQAKILNVRIDSTSTAQVLRFVYSSLNKNDLKSKFIITTPNPEHVMLAQKDSDFRNIINSSDVAIPDGIGLIQAQKFLSLPNPKDKIIKLITLFVQGLGVGFATLFDRSWLESDFKLVKGRELFMELIKLANKKAWRVFLLGGDGDEAAKAKSELEKSYKKLIIETNKGPILDSTGSPLTQKDAIVEKKVIKEINACKPHLLFVGISAPKQEKWLYRHRKSLNIGGAMVVGGTFRYISGEAKLPPRWLSDLNLEWLWRLFSGSQNMDRIFTAFPKFPLAVFEYKLNR